MYVSFRDIDRLVREGGEVAINYWAYDIVADRLEKTGFKRRSGIEQIPGLVPFDASMYSNDAGDKVLLTTQRLMGPVTIVKSTPASPEKPAPKG